MGGTFFSRRGQVGGGDLMWRGIFREEYFPLSREG